MWKWVWHPHPRPSLYSVWFSFCWVGGFFGSRLFSSIMFFWVCQFMSPGRMCKDESVIFVSLHPFNSRDVHHMTPVTNQCCVTYIMWCISYCVIHIIWSDSRFRCCVTSLTYTCVTYAIWPASPSWLPPHDLSHEGVPGHWYEGYSEIIPRLICDLSVIFRPPTWPKT